MNGYVDVLLNVGAAGPGTFGPPLRLGVGIFPVEVVASDLDGDGNVDLASVERLSDRLSVHLATGGGAFAPAVPYPAADPVSLVAAALRPGGPVDLVSTGGPVLLGDGSGAFAPGAGAFEPGLFPMDVAAADLDRDGHVDLVVANDATDHVTVLRGDGTGAFPDAVTWQTGMYPGLVEVADLNGDGWPDLLAVLHQNGGIGSNASVVRLGVGGGALGPSVALDGQPFAVADLNGDGRPDLVGSHFDERTWTYRLDVWLNATP
ncbi:MAG TPA: VCBS repeat-containing protein [Anaeromyxobacteraceae bacterium]|nr:VCBS repeat-containing protein [Anaeromyxobacteraceae bacterium]